MLRLDRLGREQIEAMIFDVAGQKPLPPDMFAQIISKTDGVPLFVEELTKSVLESGLLEVAGDRHTNIGALPPLAIPTTLLGSLTARLDRLGPVKEIAQIGAAIGREFSYRLLAAVAPMSGATVTRCSCPTRGSRVDICPGRGCRIRPMCSSMRWFKTQLTAPWFAASGSNFMVGSPMPWRRDSPRRSKPNPSSWLIISSRLALPSGLSAIFEKLAKGRSSVQLTRRQSAT